MTHCEPVILARGPGTFHKVWLLQIGNPLLKWGQALGLPGHPREVSCTENAREETKVSTSHVNLYTKILWTEFHLSAFIHYLAPCFNRVGT